MIMEIQPQWDGADAIFSKPWWTVQDVAKYLTLLKEREISQSGARTFMRRNQVKRSPADRQLTTRAWVDEAFRKGRKE